VPEAERTLSQKELNRALLARQLLLERGKSPIPKTLERMGGLQAQHAPSMYVGLWSRMEDFQRESLTRSLERRSVVQGTLLRSTIHLVTPRDWWTWSEAVRATRRKHWLRYHDLSAAEMAAAARKVRKRLADGPLRRKELHDLIGKGSAGVNGVNLWLDLVRIPPSGTWDRRRADLYGLAEEDRPKVFNPKTPQSVATFIADGQVAGTWKFVRGSIRVEPFRKLDKAIQRELDAEADRLADFHG
jgi:hypothetical protein